MHSETIPLFCFLLLLCCLSPSLQQPRSSGKSREHHKHFSTFDQSCSFGQWIAGIFFQKFFDNHLGETRYSPRCKCDFLGQDASSGENGGDGGCRKTPTVTLAQLENGGSRSTCAANEHCLGFAGSTNKDGNSTFTFTCCPTPPSVAIQKGCCYTTDPVKIFNIETDTNGVQSLVTSIRPGCPKDFLVGLIFTAKGVVSRFCAVGLQNRNYKPECKEDYRKQCKANGGHLEDDDSTPPPTADSDIPVVLDDTWSPTSGPFKCPPSKDSIIVHLEVKLVTVLKKIVKVIRIRRKKVSNDAQSAPPTFRSTDFVPDSQLGQLKPGPNEVLSGIACIIGPNGEQLFSKTFCTFPNESPDNSTPEQPESNEVPSDGSPAIFDAPNGGCIRDFVIEVVRVNVVVVRIVKVRIVRRKKPKKAVAESTQSPGETPAPSDSGETQAPSDSGATPGTSGEETPAPDNPAPSSNDLPPVPAGKPTPSDKDWSFFCQPGTVIVKVSVKIVVTGGKRVCIFEFGTAPLAQPEQAVRIRHTQPFRFDSPDAPQPSPGQNEQLGGVGCFFDKLGNQWLFYTYIQYSNQAVDQGAPPQDDQQDCNDGDDTGKSSESQPGYCVVEISLVKKANAEGFRCIHRIFRHTLRSQFIGPIPKGQEEATPSPENQPTVGDGQETPTDKPCAYKPPAKSIIGSISVRAVTGPDGKPRLAYTFNSQPLPDNDNEEPEDEHDTAFLPPDSPDQYQPEPDEFCRGFEQKIGPNGEQLISFKYCKFRNTKVDKDQQEDKRQDISDGKTHSFGGSGKCVQSVHVVIDVKQVVVVVKVVKVVHRKKRPSGSTTSPEEASSEAPVSTTTVAAETSAPEEGSSESPVTTEAAETSAPEESGSTPTPPSDVLGPETSAPEEEGSTPTPDESGLQTVPDNTDSPKVRKGWKYNCRDGFGIGKIAVRIIGDILICNFESKKIVSASTASD